MLANFWNQWVTPDNIRNALTLAGVLVAVVSVLSIKSTAKKKQTADLLFSIRSDERLITGTHAVLELHNKPDQNMRVLASPAHKGDQDVQNIRYILNHYERLSVGLQSGIYHEKMLKKSQYTIITKTYECAKPFIDGVREQTNSSTAFQEFEWLATRWQSKPLKKKKKA